MDLSSTLSVMFVSSVQPALVSLFSSTSSDCLGLFEMRTDTALQADSFICTLNDASSAPQPPEPAQLLSLPAIVTQQESDGDDEDSEGRNLCQTVLHMQSPTLRTTYIRCPPFGDSRALGLRHPLIHLQVRNLGREWALEVGIVDRNGRAGSVRCSTFQVLSHFLFKLGCEVHLKLGIQATLGTLKPSSVVGLIFCRAVIITTEA